MSAYRYVVFPRGKQPSDVEVRELQSFAGALANQFAYGTCRDDGRLTIAFDARAFDHVATIDPGFEPLLQKWQARGCELLDHLGFVKDPAALHPVREPRGSSPRSASAAIPPLHNETRLAAKELAAKEAIARSLLSVERTIQRYAAFQRIAAAMPYLLIALVAMATLAAGLYIRDQMQNSGRESRHETIERVVNDPLRESLTDSPPDKIPSSNPRQ